MGKALAVLVILIGITGLSFGVFMAGYEYHQPREIVVERWHEPEIKVVEIARYEPLPEEYIDAAIRGIEQARDSHILYLAANPDLGEGIIAFHQKTMDKYAVSLMAFEIMKLNYSEGGGESQ